MGPIIFDPSNSLLKAGASILFIQNILSLGILIYAIVFPQFEMVVLILDLVGFGLIGVYLYRRWQIIRIRQLILSSISVLAWVVLSIVWRVRYDFQLLTNIERKAGSFTDLPNPPPSVIIPVRNNPCRSMARSKLRPLSARSSPAVVRGRRSAPLHERRAPRSKRMRSSSCG